MDLRGWDYTGRNIGPDFHRQICMMFNCLSDSAFVKNRTWGGEIQEALKTEVHVASSGVIRTLKKLCDDFGFFNEEAFASTIDSQNILTERGKTVHSAAIIEMQIDDNTSSFSDSQREEARIEIKRLYEEVYCEVFLRYRYKNVDGSFFFPLRATLRALKKYRIMDKWEWYLLNTCVRHNDDPQEEAELDRLISQYKNHLLSFTMGNVTEKPKGHQYIPQYFEYAGLVSLVQRPEWSISTSSQHQEIQDLALSDQFFSSL